MKKINSMIAVFMVVVHFPVAQAQSSVEASTTQIAGLIDTDIDKAEAMIEALLEKAPTNPEAHFLCGRIMGRQASDAIFSALSYAGKSLKCFKTAVSLAPTDVRYRQGLLRFYLGAPAIAGGSEELAKQQVEKIRQIDAVEGARAEIVLLDSTENSLRLITRLAEFRRLYPEVPGFHFRHGLLLQEQRRFEDAYTAFTQALSAAEKAWVPDYPDATERTSDHQKTQSDYVNALYQIGRNAVFSENHIEHGISALLQYVDYVSQAGPFDGAPPKAWGYLRLAQLYSLQGETEKVEQNLALTGNSEDQALHSLVRELRLRHSSD